MSNPIELWRGHRTPTRDFARWNQFFDRFLDDLDWPMTRGQSAQSFFAPPCEVAEDKAHYIFKFDLPGVAKEQVRLEIHENQFTISGERREEKKEDCKRCHCAETQYGSFLRTFTLPANIDAERVEAKFENGVLTVNIAKTEQARARTVSIK